jgi:hypothetical protein
VNGSEQRQRPNGERDAKLFINLWAQVRSQYFLVKAASEYLFQSQKVKTNEQQKEVLSRIPVTLALGRRRQEYHKLKASLDYTARPCLQK